MAAAQMNFWQAKSPVLNTHQSTMFSFQEKAKVQKNIHARSTFVKSEKNMQNSIQNISI